MSHCLFKVIVCLLKVMFVYIVIVCLHSHCSRLLIGQFCLHSIIFHLSIFLGLSLPHYYIFLSESSQYSYTVWFILNNSYWISHYIHETHDLLYKDQIYPYLPTYDNSKVDKNGFWIQCKFQINDSNRKMIIPFET